MKQLKIKKILNLIVRFGPTLDKGPYYAIQVTPGIHHTMGGVK